jgi:hypothetical protein
MLMRKKGRFLIGILAVSLSSAGAAFGQAHEEKPPTAANKQPAPSPTSPGPEQAFLANRAGDYTRVITFVGQDGEWSGTSKISVILGGRFVLEENRDTVMGRAVEGTRLWGYNNATKQYEAAWMYTMSTAITKLTGTSNDGGKTVEYTSTADEPRLHARVRQTDDDHFVVTLSTAGPDGKDTPFQETTYARKK